MGRSLRNLHPMSYVPYSWGSRGMQKPSLRATIKKPNHAIIRVPRPRILFGANFQQHTIAPVWQLIFDANPFHLALSSHTTTVLVIFSRKLSGNGAEAKDGEASAPLSPGTGTGEPPNVKASNVPYHSDCIPSILHALHCGLEFVPVFYSAGIRPAASA